jgi:superfamily II DNA helicase RecQ
MKVKHCYIRLNDADLHKDEEDFNNFINGVSVKKTATQYIANGQLGFWSILVFFEEKITNNETQSVSSEKTISFDPSSLNLEERNRYEVLRKWRSDTAARENFANYIVASNAHLGAIARLNPNTKEELYSIKGFGEKKCDKYGEEIIAVLNSI